MNRVTIDVLVPAPLFHPLSYLVPPHLVSPSLTPSHACPVLTLGRRVTIAMRKRVTEGYVLCVRDNHTGYCGELKEILSVSELPPFFDTPLFKFYEWVAAYYHVPIGEVLRAAIPKLVFPKRKIKITRSEKTFTPLLEKNTFSLKTLNEKQRDAVERINKSIEGGHADTFLLYGVTGSGKTEVFLRSIQSVLDIGKSALILVPEIALTPQLIELFCNTFGEGVGLLHSGLTPLMRTEQWLRLLQSKTRVLLGVRSAIFAPLQNLGLIVIDEEHETSFKQEGGLCYHARDLALVRARFTNASVVLSTATPSLETFVNASLSKYTPLVLPERVQSRPLPSIELVDLRKEKNFAAPFISDPLYRALWKTLQAGQQSILFLNRKGFAPTLLCQGCGHVPSCPNCSVSLTYYQRDRNAKCHYCAHQIVAQEICSECRSSPLIPIGIGTEQIEKSLSSLIPHARIGRFDKDMMTSSSRLDQFVRAIHKGKIDIIVGTQLIAKGHDVPNISLVGVILADLSFNFPDFRAHEHTVQLLTQVAGRTGRGNLPGHVLIQTYQPDHPCFNAISSMEHLNQFYTQELSLRDQAHFPPRWKLINSLLSGVCSEKVEQGARELFARMEEIRGQLPSAEREKIELLGPSPAPLSRLRGKSRWQILIRSAHRPLLHTFLNNVKKFMADTPRLSGVDIAFDVDPYHLL